MSRKAAIIAIILLLQNLTPEYQLTIALIVMFMYNLLHVKYHPYDLFYHDRLEFLSLVSSEMTLFGGLVITFLGKDKEICQTDCLDLKSTADAASEAIGYVIIIFNMMFLVYFTLGLLYHMYFVLVPQQCRCAKVEKAGAAAHEAVKKLPMGEKLFPTRAHSLMDDYYEGRKMHSRSSDQTISRTAERLVAQQKRDEAELAKQLGKEQGDAHRRVQERLLKKKNKKRNQHGAGKKQGGGKVGNGYSDESDEEVSIEMVSVEGKSSGNHPLTGRANVTVL